MPAMATSDAGAHDRAGRPVEGSPGAPSLPPAITVLPARAVTVSPASAVAVSPGCAVTLSAACAVTLSLALTIVLAGAVDAEHAVQYRFLVLGFVTDADGRPVAEQPIQVIRDKTGLAYRGATDSRGFYVVVVRLGDESAGEPLTLSIGPAASIHIVAHFDPKNHADERGTRVDLVAGRIVERPESFPPTLREFLGGS
jgi:hypothetical protein